MAKSTSTAESAHRKPTNLLRDWVLSRRQALHQGGAALAATAAAGTVASVPALAVEDEPLLAHWHRWQAADAVWIAADQATNDASAAAVEPVFVELPDGRQARCRLDLDRMTMAADLRAAKVAELETRLQLAEERAGVPALKEHAGKLLSRADGLGAELVEAPTDSLGGALAKARWLVATVDIWGDDEDEVRAARTMAAALETLYARHGNLSSPDQP